MEPAAAAPACFFGAPACFFGAPACFFGAPACFLERQKSENYMSGYKCRFCDKILSTPSNLNRHINRDCSVIQVSKTMSDLRIGRSDERGGEVALRKKSKSRERGSDGVDPFDMQTA